MARTTAEELWIGGETKGRAEGKAETVLTLLRAKFRRIPKEIEKSVCQMINPIALDSLAVYVLHCDTMDEFVAAIK